MIFAPNMSTFIVSNKLRGNENTLIREIIELKFLGVEYNPRSGSAYSIIVRYGNKIKKQHYHQKYFFKFILIQFKKCPYTKECMITVSLLFRCVKK